MRNYSIFYLRISIRPTWADADGIAMIDIAEGATGALQIISRDSSARDRIRNEKWEFIYSNL